MNVPIKLYKACQEQHEGHGFGEWIDLWNWLMEDLTVLEAEAWLLPETCLPWAPEVGGLVRVRHLGIWKTGIVLDVRKTRATVQVKIYEGKRDQQNRQIHPYISELKEVR